MNGHSFEVNGKSYNSNFKILSENLLFFNRTHTRKGIVSEIDAFPNMWTLAFANVDPDKVGVWRQGQKIRVEGPWAVFIPPFSMVKWHLMPGTLVWDAFLSFAPLPLNLQEKAFVFPWNGKDKPNNLKEIINLLENAEGRIDITNENVFNTTAFKTKKIIDRTFMDHNFSIALVAEELGVTHAFVSRSFKKSYGISPVTYRNRMRVFESSKLMLFGGHNVTSAGHEVGFLDSARFHKQFRSEMNAVPSEFCVEKKKNRNELIAERVNY